MPRWSAALALVLAGVLSSPVLAQDPAASPPTEEEKAKAAAEAAAAEEQEVVEEVITVTSRLREETIQEVPFSIIAPVERAAGAGAS